MMSNDRKIMNGIDDGRDDFLDRAEYEEMRDDLLGDPEQLEEEVGFGEIMINIIIVKLSSCLKMTAD